MQSLSKTKTIFLRKRSFVLLTARVPLNQWIVYLNISYSALFHAHFS